MPRSSIDNKPRPLLVRPGARFRCEGDGLCCTDLHGLGPLTRSEVREMRRLVPGSVIYSDDVEGHCMRPGDGGGCAQLEADGRCGIHARFGADKKPTGCLRFPYGLVSTPQGGRITTEHRCPCRTLGQRPPLDPQDAERSLLDRAGRLEVDNEVPGRIPLTTDRRVGFARYRSLEQDLLDRLASGEQAEGVLGAEPFPALHESGWQVFAGEFLDMRDGTRGGTATVWFGDALLALLEGYKPPERPRPWRDAFERGAARADEPDDPERIFNDWLADEIWMFRWLELDCPFDVARAELATRLAAARWIHKRLGRMGVRSDQAAAEAVMVAEVAGITSQWPDVVDAIANEPSPASDLEA